LLSADAANLYNVMDVSLTAFSGTTAPAACCYVSLKHGASGTEFLRVYIPTEANKTISESYSFNIPSRSAINQAIVCQLTTALGTGGQYSVVVHAYKTTS
jgi:hypothetical protein